MQEEVKEFGSLSMADQMTLISGLHSLLQRHNLEAANVKVLDQLVCPISSKDTQR
jgi:hypothetical protein